MVGELIRLRFAIQRHTVSWKRLLGAVLGVVAAVGTWAATLLAEPAARSDVLSLVLAFWLVGWVVGPILTSGASVLRPEYFALLPLDRRRLGLGLLTSVFVGVGAVVTALAALALTAYAVAVAPGRGVLVAVAVAVLGAVLLVVVVVAVSRAVYALLGAAMRSWLGVEIAAIQYGLLIASLFAAWLVISPLIGAVPVFLRDGLAGPGADTASWALGLLPTGWPVRAVDAVAAGEPLTALGLLLALAGAALLAVVAAAALLTPRVDARTARRRRRPLGSRVLDGSRILPATPLGAVLGRELRVWWRDPWRSLEVRSAIWVGVFIAIYAGIGGAPWLAPFAGAAIALMVALSGANLFGQDGTALWMLVVTDGPRALRAEIRGRQLALLVVFTPPAVALSAVMVALTGRYDVVVPVVAVLVALLGVGSAVAVLLSVVGVTPGVDPHRRVNPTDAGENGLMIQVALWTTQLLAAAPVAMAVVLAIGADGLPGWFAAATLAVAVAVAGLVAFVGGRLAIGYLTARLPETFARLRYPGIRTAPAGGGWLDALSRSAENETIKARAAAR